MIPVEPGNPLALYGAALAHLFYGLLKSDGVISEAELSKLEELASLHAPHMDVRDRAKLLNMVQQIVKDKDYDSWRPYQHYNRGMEYLDEFVESGAATTSQLQEALNMLEELAGADGIDLKERVYVDNLLDDLRKKYEVK